MPEMIHATDEQAVELREEASREIAIRLLPHGEIADRGTFTEEYGPSAHEGSDPTKVVIRDAHRRESMADILGMGREWEVRDDATWLVGTLAPTPEGDRGLALARMGALRASAGFYPVAGGDRIEQRNGRRHIVRDRIAIAEAGLLTQPAYHSTAVEAREEEEAPVENLEIAAPPAPAAEERDDRPVLAVPSIITRRPVTAAEYAVLQVRSASGNAAATARLMEIRETNAPVLEQETTADVAAGALPPSVVGDLVSALVRRVPVFAAYTRLGLPETGMTFNRPKVTQHSLIGYQAAEKSLVASRDVKFDADPVNIFTVAGALNISRQFIDRTPYWGRVFADMVAAYGNFLNAELAGAGNGTTAVKGLKAYAGTPTATGATPDGEKLTAAVYTAWAALMDGEQEQGPDLALMNATTWGTIAKMVDAQKRPIFPAMGPVNASGTSDLNGPGPFFGLPVVITKAVEDNIIYLPIRDALEFYASPSGDQPFVLSVDEPGILGVETAIYGYVATYAKPDAVAAVKIGATA
jgi:HK97 family phage major capsid protein